MDSRSQLGHGVRHYSQQTFYCHACRHKIGCGKEVQPRSSVTFTLACGRFAHDSEYFFATEEQLNYSIRRRCETTQFCIVDARFVTLVSSRCYSSSAMSAAAYSSKFLLRNHRCAYLNCSTRFLSRVLQLSILDIVRVTNKDALKRLAHLESSLTGEHSVFLYFGFTSHSIVQRTSCLSRRCSSQSSAPPAICTNPCEKRGCSQSGRVIV